MPQVDRNEVIDSWVLRIADALEDILPNVRNESEFRHAIEPLIDAYCSDVGVNPTLRREYTLASGIADAVFDGFIIEYKSPGIIKKTLDKKTRDATEQLKGYIEDLPKKEERIMHRVAGAAFDGRYLIFERLIDGKWTIELPMDVNRNSLWRFLSWISSLSSGIALTSENLSRDFSLDQPRTRDVLKSLYVSLNSTLNNSDGIVNKLFEQWRLFFSESIDYSQAFGGKRLQSLKNWVKGSDIEVSGKEDAERFFYCLHTYFALIVKFIAWLALSRHLGLKIGGPSFGELSSLDGESLRRSMADMESGGIFRAYRIDNLLEGDFFSWYVYAWDERIERAVSNIFIRLDEYDPNTIRTIPGEARDLFKKLYHYMLPRDIRHNLGEYYTPDWLAQRLLTQIDSKYFIGKPTATTEKSFKNMILSTRFLDPACGSGTFLVLIIERILQLGRELPISDSDLLDSIFNNVIGFDLNPLAVLTARVNYLLALGDHFGNIKSRIAIPIYLADSVRAPSTGRDLFSAEIYEFQTAIGKFIVPVVVCIKGRFDRFCGLLEDCVKDEYESSSFLHKVETELNIEEGELTSGVVEMLEDLYLELLALHRNGMNGLWARLLKNNFAPITSGVFDCIVGNPPWIVWDNLPDDYRKSIMPVWNDYGLLPHSGMDTILGKGKKDISMLMTYTVADNLLKRGGRLGFVITQSVFKTGSGQGFRKFYIPREKGKAGQLKVIQVDDMVSIKPFEGAANRTSVMILKKGSETTYPIKYQVWKRLGRARINYDSSLEEVIKSTVRFDYHAEPVIDDDDTSPWITARPKTLKAIRKALGNSEYNAFEGANSGGANAVYWIEVVDKLPSNMLIVRNITEGAGVAVDDRTASVESNLVYPLLRGKDVQRWGAKPSAHILMVQDPNKRRGIEEDSLQKNFPNTYSYLKSFETVLRSRAAFNRYFIRSSKKTTRIETGPFYSMFNVGLYTFSPWKVVWREQAKRMTAAVIGMEDDKPIIPDHKLMLVATDSEEEAHYVCSLLNSSIFIMAVLGYAIDIQMNTHIVNNVRLPLYDVANREHRYLSRLSIQAHEAMESNDYLQIESIENEIDLKAAVLYGLSNEELQEIKGCIQEITNGKQMKLGS